MEHGAHELELRLRFSIGSLVEVGEDELLTSESKRKEHTKTKEECQQEPPNQAQAPKQEEKRAGKRTKGGVLNSPPGA